MHLLSCAQRRRCSAVLLAIALVGGPAAAQESEAGGSEPAGESVSTDSKPASTGCVALCADPSASGADMLFDAAVLRPMSAAQTLVGIPFFVAALPFAWPSGQLDDAWEFFLQVPFEETFTRKLGNF